MGRRVKPPTGKEEAKRSRSGKSPKNEGSRVRDLEKRLAEAEEQQAATAEILRVIRQSPIELQPVFETIIENATRICRGRYGTLNLFDGSRIHQAAHYNLTPEAVEQLHQIYPMSPGPDSLPALAVLHKRMIHVADLEAEPAVPPSSRTMARILGHRSLIIVPMIRENVLLGTLNIARAEVGLFPNAQVELLKTFADQAVIAIENVRLFTELQEKNRALTEAHAQVTAALEQ